MAYCETGDLGPWTATTSLPQRVDTFAGAALGGRIYVTGGFAIPTSGPAGASAAVFYAQPSFDGSVQSWSLGTPLPSPRYAHAMTSDNATRTLYVVGGVTPTSNGSPDVLVSRVAADGSVGQWSLGPPLPEGRQGLTLVAYNGSLYALDGITAVGNVMATYFRAPIRADGTLGAWKTGFFTAGPGRRFARSFAFDGRMYNCGGFVDYDSPHTLVSVSPIATSGTIWTGLASTGDLEPSTTTTSLPAAIADQSLVMANGFLYLAGGDGPYYNVLSSSVSVNSIKSDGTLGSWRPTQTLPQGRTLHASVAARGYLYVLGGDIPGSFGANEVTATVLRAALPADTMPPRTVASPLPGENSARTFAVTLYATDVGGSGVLRTYVSTDGSRASTGSGSYSAPITVTAPATVSFFSVDATGNTEVVTTLNYAAPAVRYATQFDYPVGKPDHHGWRRTQAFLDCIDYPTEIPNARCRHLGEDWAPTTGSVVGSDVFAIADGEVIAVGNTVLQANGTTRTGRMGYVVFVKHPLPAGSQYEYVISLYGHLGSRSLASLGPIRRGDRVGVVGSTAENGGYVPHVHLEIRTPEAVGTPDLFEPIVKDNPETGVGDGYHGSGPGTYTAALGWVSPSAWIDSRRATSPAPTAANPTKAAGGAPASNVTLSLHGDLVGVQYGDTFKVFQDGAGQVAEDGVGIGTLGTGTGFSSALSGRGTVQAFVTDAASVVAGSADETRGLVLVDVASGSQTVLSTSMDGSAASGGAFDASMTSDGRVVAFSSAATDIVSGDTNDVSDVFVADRVIGDLSRVSVAADGTEGEGPSYSPAISDDGRWIAFVSEASNLVPGDGNSQPDVFVVSLIDGRVVRASGSTSGGDPNGPSRAPSISGDGRFVVFESDASNLVAGDTNQRADVFRLDRLTGATSRVNVRTDGSQTSGACRRPRIAPRSDTITFLSEDSELGPGTVDAPAAIVVRSFAVPAFRVHSSKLVLGKRGRSRGTAVFVGTLPSAAGELGFDPASTWLRVSIDGSPVVEAAASEVRAWRQLKSGVWRLRLGRVQGVRGPATATWNASSRTFTIHANGLDTDDLRARGAAGHVVNVEFDSRPFVTAVDFDARHGAFVFPAHRIKGIGQDTQ